MAIEKGAAPLLTAKAIVEKVMEGQTVVLPTVQFAQFLYECDTERLEFAIDATQQGGAIILSRWESNPGSLKGVIQE